jgi:predicted Zn-dependent protease
MSRRCALLVLAAVALACATSPTGRRQLKLFPEAQMSAMGAAAYDTMRAEMPRSRDERLARSVRCITDALAAEVQGPYAGVRWEVTVFEEPSPNAFALPGGKIGVHTGLFEVARNQHQLATVLGHELAHVMADHSNERVSTAFAAQTGLDLVAALSGEPSATQQQLLGLLGVGAQVGVLLPFGRTQEREADSMGLDLMARAGFDPRESVVLWRNMSRAGDGAPPEFLSTHPSHGTRIADLEARMGGALLVYEGAQQRGRRPSC